MPFQAQLHLVHSRALRLLKELLPMERMMRVVKGQIGPSHRRLAQKLLNRPQRP